MSSSRSIDDSSSSRSISAGASMYVLVWAWKTGAKPRARASDSARARPSAKRAQPASSSRSDGSSLPRPGLREALGRAAVAEHGPCRERLRGLEQVERALQLGQVTVDVLGLREPDRAPAAGQLEARSLEPGAQLAAVAEVAGRAELRALVARAGDRVEQLVRAGHVRVDADRQLERAVRERRVRDPHARDERHARILRHARPTSRAPTRAPGRRRRPSCAGRRPARSGSRSRSRARP